MPVYYVTFINSLPAVQASMLNRLIHWDWEMREQPEQSENHKLYNS